MNVSTARTVWVWAVLLALAGCGGGDGKDDGKDDGQEHCGTSPDTSTVGSFFSSLSCTWTLYADDRVEAGTTDTRFIHGKAYKAVLRADQTLTLESESGELVYAYATSSGSYSDEGHEANVFMRPSGESLIIQYDKAAHTLQVVLTATSQGYNWSFASTRPPSVFDAAGLGFMAGTWASKLTYVYSAAGSTEAALCDPVKVVLDAEGNAEVTLAGRTIPFAFDKAASFVGASGTIGAKDIFRLERCYGPKHGSTCDITELGVWWSRPAGTTDAPVLYKIQVTLQGTGGTQSFYTADLSQVAAKCP